MNDRIKELAEQFKTTVGAGEFGEYEVMMWYNVEEFAELIIQECISVCENGYEGEFTICGIKQCVSDLKKHFGVE